jgi:hypothetical protein
MGAAKLTPLWPAGHLPLKGEDWLSWRLSLITDLAELAVLLTLPISPLEGEMPGRAEGGLFRSADMTWDNIQC